MCYSKLFLHVCAGLLISMRNARYSQLRCSAYATANKIVEYKEALKLSRKQLETFSDTIVEQSNSEKNPALQRDICKLADNLHG